MFTSPFHNFADRHIGIDEKSLTHMLSVIGAESLDQLIDQTVPSDIRRKTPLNVPPALSEFEYLQELKKTAGLNKVFRSFIGLGYNGTITPSAILRNVFQNPGWYTQYTPYQAEIAQGRLEALLNYQTMVSDLTGLPIANASLLDEGTAASEAMHMFFESSNKKSKTGEKTEFFISDKVLPQTIEVCITRAKPIGIKVVTGDWKSYVPNERSFGVLIQYPDVDGQIDDYTSLVEKCTAHDVFVTVATDLMSLALLKAPGEWGADAVVGNSQRFGVPMGFGGPHAAFFATKDEFKRLIPGRIIGVSEDADNNRALRMALQTREQHIKREKATSNICTAQALLAIMASMYAVYHGPHGIHAIASAIHEKAAYLESSLNAMGYKQANSAFFDTIKVEVNAGQLKEIQDKALNKGYNFFYGDQYIRIALDETCTVEDLNNIISIFGGNSEAHSNTAKPENRLNQALVRTSEYLTHPVFNSYHTESKMMRYIKRLENKDLSLVHSMIPLGSCTMKLNAATELIPVSWPEFADIHPFVPKDQAAGYYKVIEELGAYLCDMTGFTACSFQPNSGAQGEYAGLLTIRAYHEAHGQGHRNISLIPSSAHGTNPASAVLAGMDVVVVSCDEKGNIEVSDLKAKAEKYADRLSCLMVTYPSTHGVFETSIKEICQIIHDFGGLVYMDGANMNAQVGLTSPAEIGADVNHLNLHKTYAIPHGGGGPGMGPICVNDKLAPYMPGHIFQNKQENTDAVSSAPFGSASILLISYAYCKMLGDTGLVDATRYAILNANYIKSQLEKYYEVLYTGEFGRTAHELIIDLRPFKNYVSAEDVAKRLMDYGFHAPTLSFPVAGTLMIEPTESESLEELDRFVEAMVEIRNEIEEIINGIASHDVNVLNQAPHTAQCIITDKWEYPYSREKAAYPLSYLKDGFKFWPSVRRVNNALGDRNLICVCPPIEAYADTEA